MKTIDNSRTNAETWDVMEAFNCEPDHELVSEAALETWRRLGPITLEDHKEALTKIGVDMPVLDNEKKHFTLVGPGRQAQMSARNETLLDSSLNIDAAIRHGMERQVSDVRIYESFWIEGKKIGLYRLIAPDGAAFANILDQNDEIIEMYVYDSEGNSILDDDDIRDKEQKSQHPPPIKRQGVFGTGQTSIIPIKKLEEDELSGSPSKPTFLSAASPAKRPATATLFSPTSSSGGFAAGLSQVGTMGGFGGAAQFGSPQSLQTGGFGARPRSAGITFGQASSLGGAGSLFGNQSNTSSLGLMQAPTTAADDNDAYNIELDLDALSAKKAKPEKPFERRTSEERLALAKEISANVASCGAQSILKKREKRDTSRQLTFGQCQIHEYDRNTHHDSTFEMVNVRDISDMRDERTRMAAMLQERENEQLAAFRKQQAAMDAYIGGSKPNEEKKTNAYGSTKKSGIDQWPGKV